MSSSSLFFHDTSTTKIYTLSLHDALPISGGAGDPVLASHRARAAAGSGDRRPDAVRVPGSHEHRAAVVPAAGAAPVLQHGSVHPDDGGDVLPRVPKLPRRRADAVQLRAPPARGDELTTPFKRPP